MLSFFTYYLRLQIEHMMDVGEDTEYEQTAMRVALNSEGGKRMEDLVSGKIRHLKVFEGLTPKADYNYCISAKLDPPLILEYPCSA